MFASVAFGGSRALVGAQWPGLVGQVMGAVVAGGARVSVGCCVGADELVILKARRAGAQLSVFAAFGPGPRFAGACSLSSTTMVALAAAGGAQVRWWAGGGPAVPLVGRLAQRTAACVRSAQALVLFAPGAGSLAAAVPAAVAAQLPVFVFATTAPSSGPAWSAGSFVGLPCWCWAPAAVQVAMF